MSERMILAIAILVPVALLLIGWIIWRFKTGKHDDIWEVVKSKFTSGTH